MHYFKKTIALFVVAFITIVMLPAPASAASDFSYSTLSDGTISIDAYTGAGGNVSIPSKIDGKSVTVIGHSAFWLCSSLTGVTIPGSVVKIQDYAFYGCTKLTSVTIQSGVQAIGIGAFKSCTSLTGVNIPGSVAGIGDTAFEGCSKLTSATMQTGVKTIGKSAFINCTSLASVTISDSVTSIGDNAFRHCTSLAGVTIPGSVTGMGDGAFIYCEKLKDASFLGDAPSAFGDGVFSGTVSGFRIHYTAGKSGWTTPTWKGYATVAESAFTVQNFTAASAGYDSIKLSWSKTVGANGYEVCRATSQSGNYSKVAAITSGSTLSYTNKSLTSGKTYFYKVKAYRTVSGAKVYSSFSAVKSAVPVPSKPAVSAASLSYNSVKISWKKISGANGYEVYRAASKTGKYTKVTAITSGATLNYINKSLTAGNTYYYQVRAYRTVNKAKVYGSFSSSVSARPVPAKPASVKAKRASSSSIKVTWTKVSGASGYEIYRATSKSGKYAISGTIKSGSTVIFTNNNLTKGKTYFYQVRAYRTVSGKKVYGSFSGIVSAKP
jgi:fibronectin type 3 domain-containing protein